MSNNHDHLHCLRADRDALESFYDGLLDGVCPCCNRRSLIFPASRNVFGQSSLDVNCTACGWSFLQNRDAHDEIVRIARDTTGDPPVITQRMLMELAHLRTVAAASEYLRRYITDGLCRGTQVESGLLEVQLEVSRSRSVTWEEVEEILGPETAQRLKEVLPLHRTRKVVLGIAEASQADPAAALQSVRRYRFQSCSPRAFRSIWTD